MNADPHKSALIHCFGAPPAARVTHLAWDAEELRDIVAAAGAGVVPLCLSGSAGKFLKIFKAPKPRFGLEEFFRQIFLFYFR